ncbi:hypothetical protein ACSVBT_04250 [Afipia sp. TerB]
MRDNIRTPDTILNAEIKALLILLLLKTGIPSSEIQTALRLASDQASARDRDDAPGPQAKIATGAAPSRQRVRNDYLPPFKSYAA